MTNCPKCGAELQEGCTTCPQCGQDLNQSEVETTEKKSMHPAALGGITAGALVGGVMLCALIGALIGGNLFHFNHYNRHHDYEVEEPDSAYVDTAAYDTYNTYEAPEPTIYGNHTLTGSIGGANMVLELQIDSNDNATCSAYYTKYGPSNRLYGNGEISNGYLSLQEYDDNGNWAGSYSGTFDGETFDGTYEAASGHTYSFTLTAQ